ncbi:hypothetical protein JHK86_006342 [Glycine max]|nr:hypothetical protein JHK86_006342 [Glycine max]
MFFMGLNMKVDHIKVLLKDSEKNDSVAVGLERLKDKALITISEDNVISMHDIKQEKASEIVRLESIVDPGNRSRLMHPDDTYEVLKYNKGTEAIRSIRADLSVIRKLQEFFCGKPGILDLSHNQVEKLWDGVQKLKVSGSENLKELPDLSEATNLEVLDINFCPQLTSVTPSIFSLNRLERLSVAYCSLRKITSKNHLSSLRYLNLESCKKLREFSVASENMIELDLSSTCVNAFNSSFGCQSKLKILQLRESGIESLPSSFKKLTRLQYLNFPSVAQQFNENRKEVLFWNCLKLDEDSLKAVKLNAHINLRKFAYQHLSAPDENFDDYNRTYGSDQLCYIRSYGEGNNWLLDLHSISLSKNQKRFKIKVEAMEAAVACQRDVGLKGLGVSLINTSAYHSFRKHINTTKHRNFVQEMSTSADHSFIQRIKTSADHQLHSANKILSRSQLHSTNGSI